jgi:hypothetical protein
VSRINPTSDVPEVWQPKGLAQADPCVAVVRRFAREYPMSHDTNNQSQRSQDAVRHQKDGLHHKFPKDPQPGAAEKRNARQSQAKAQQDSVEMQQNEGLPEVPKVGSRDAPGG